MTQFTDGQTVVNAAWLNGVDKAVNQSGTTAGAALISYTPPGTGAVATTVSERLIEPGLSVFDFMTPAQIADVQSWSPSLNHSSAVQAAVNACSGRLFFPWGKYRFEGVSITNGLEILGEGVGYYPFNAGTNIYPITASGINFTVNTDDAVFFHGLNFQGIASHTGAAITITSGATANINSTVEKCVFNSCGIGVNLIRAESTYVHDCYFTNIVQPGGIGIFIDNTYNRDAGGANIYKNYFQGNPSGGPGAVGIYWQGGGGSSFMKNTFLQNLTKGIFCTFSLFSSFNSGQLYFHNNVFDQLSTAANGIQIDAGSGTGSFELIEVMGNSFVETSISDYMLRIIGNASLVLNQVKVSGNMFRVRSGGSAGGAIRLDGINYGLVEGNNIVGAGNGTGILLGTLCNDFNVQNNKVRNWISRITNSGGTNIAIREESNSGSASIADGGSFNHGLTATPTKITLLGSVANNVLGVSGLNSTTVFCYVKVGNTGAANAVPQTVYWTAEL